MYLVASVRLSVTTLTAEVRFLACSGQLCRVQQSAKNSHYQSKLFVCVSSNHADAVDWLLILGCFKYLVFSWVMSGVKAKKTIYSEFVTHFCGTPFIYLPWKLKFEQYLPQGNKWFARLDTLHTFLIQRKLKEKIST